MEEYIEIIERLLKKLDKEKISKGTGIEIEKINKIINHKFYIMDLSFEEVNRLYRMAMSSGINIKDKYIKSPLTSVKLDIPVRKILISRYDNGLFSIGMFIEENRNYKLENDYDKLERIKLSTHILLDKNENVIYNGYGQSSLLCGYYGGGPIAFIDFVNKYSNIKIDHIKETIVGNEIVSYNIYKDEIEGIEDKEIVQDRLNDICFYRYKNKLIISFIDRNYPIERRYTDESFRENEIKQILYIMSNKYNKNINLKQVKYIKDINTESNKVYKQAKVKMILVFEDFEIWMKSPVYGDDIFYDKEMQKFLGLLGVTVDENNIISKLINEGKKFIYGGTYSEDDIEVLNIRYEDELK